VSSGGARRIAENLAGAYPDFPRTLDQWIESPRHRTNLLMHDALRVGVASAKSPKTGRTYWAMEIAGDYETIRKPGTWHLASADPSPRLPQPRFTGALSAAYPQYTHRADFSGCVSVYMGLLRNLFLDRMVVPDQFRSRPPTPII
jgi:hypothetical protein